MSARPVVLALGDDGSVAAVRYAVELARRHCRPLHVVLAVPDGRVTTSLGDDLELRSALGLARDRAEHDVAVTASLAPGPDVVSCLVAAADRHHAAVLVLGRTGTSRPSRILSGSVLAVVTARSPVPVVVVPARWRPHPEVDPVVVVGVQDVVEAPLLLEAAASAACDLHARLVVVHSWWAGEDHAEDAAARSREHTFGRTAHANLGRCLVELQSHRPALRVDLDVSRRHPESALLAAGCRADLVVIGRHHHRVPFGSHLGPVTRALLDHCAAPVLIVTPGGAASPNDLEHP